MFTIRRGAEPDPTADVLSEPYAHTYEWAPAGSPPKLFTSADDARRFGATMLASRFHVTAA